MSKQQRPASNVDRLREVSPDVADRFVALMAALDSHGALGPKQRELCLLAGFAAARIESGFRIHCLRASQAGATVAELEQVVLLMLGTSLGISPVIETLSWLYDELP